MAWYGVLWWFGCWVFIDVSSQIWCNEGSLRESGFIALYSNSRYLCIYSSPFQQRSDRVCQIEIPSSFSLIGLKLITISRLLIEKNAQIHSILIGKKVRSLILLRFDIRSGIALRFIEMFLSLQIEFYNQALPMFQCGLVASKNFAKSFT